MPDNKKECRCEGPPLTKQLSEKELQMLDQGQSRPLSGVSAGKAIERVLEDSVQNIELRRQEILQLRLRFVQNFSIVRDLDQVNQILRKSPRPELVITERAEQEQFSDPRDLNNFGPKTRLLFLPTTQEGFVDLRPLIPKEFDDLIRIGGTSWEDFERKSQEFGITSDTRSRFCSSIGLQPALIRMLIVIPDFAQSLLNTIIELSFSREGRGEEVLVAYTLMSHLISKQDPYVVSERGQVRTTILCT